MHVTFIDTGGRTVAVPDAAPGQSLMEVAKAHDVAGITGDCGGACSCATCHVYVDAGWMARVGEPDDIEAGMLDMVANLARPNSRLACQIRLDDSLDGLSVTVAGAA